MHGLLRISAAMLLALITFSATGEDGKPQIGPWGVDLRGMDLSVKPGDDFFRYGGGTWLKETPIPADRTSWGPFFMLRAKAESDVRILVEELAHTDHEPGSTAQKIADFYRSYSDESAIEAAGLTPVVPDLAAIAAAHSPEDVARLMSRPDLAIRGPLAIEIWPDDRDPDRYSVNISQSGLGLPDRDYYLKDDSKFREIRDDYRTYIARLLTLAAYEDADRWADEILGLETAIAKLHWPANKRGDRILTYNPKSRAELEALAPDYPWQAVLSTRGITAQDLFGAKQPDAINTLASLFRTTPVATWRAYMTFHYLDRMADLLPAAFDDLACDFNGRRLSGQPAKRARWRRAITAVNGALGEAVGRLYVDRYFPPESKAQMAVLVENLRSAYGARIAGLSWMSDETKQAALLKLARLRIKIGYPDRWRDYATLEINAHDPVGNRQRAAAWEWRRKAARLGGPVDRDEWGMTPQTVNAYYNAFFNEIVFPAAILQPPYFDPAADSAVNYGGIGGVIGHEMSHGFDDQGSRSDENGRLRNWWQAQDAAHFQDLAARLAQQYGQYQPLPGMKLDGTLTLAENIGDNGGLSIALAAYRRSLAGKEPPKLDGFTGDQRFFLSWAQSYRENIRNDALRADLTSDPHSPAEFRVNGVVRNMEDWYRAFGVQPGDKLFLAEPDRVQIW